jgi:hypothetical protein
VGVATDELLAHIAAMLRADIGPAVTEPFAKTQAFMAAVILEKVAAQLRATEGSAADASAETELAMSALYVDAAAVPRIRLAVDGVRTEPTDAHWSALVRALYAERQALGEEQFQHLLGRVRPVLRARLDRVLVYAA